MPHMRTPHPLAPVEPVTVPGQVFGPQASLRERRHREVQQPLEGTTAGKPQSLDATLHAEAPKRCHLASVCEAKDLVKVSASPGIGSGVTRSERRPAFPGAGAVLA